MVTELSYISNYTQIYKRYYEFLRILNQKNITSLFQPIVNLRDGSIMGFEALSRGPAGSEFESPLALLKYATENDFLWDIEYICRQKALKKAATFLQEGQYLFINVDANIFNDPKYQAGLTKKALEELKIASENVVFEITEHSCVSSIDLYEKALSHYKEQGYRIAIDDVGTGYSNLNMLIKSRPHFLKIDMELIRNIDQDHTKQSLLKTFKGFCESCNIKLIAEGIETAEELETLIKIGVDYGQGYYLKKPSGEDFSLDPQITRLISTLSSIYDNYSANFPLALHVGSVANDEIAVAITARGSDLDQIFRHNPSVMGIPVLENKRPRGLVMRNKFYYLLGRKYGLELFLKKEVSKLMDPAPLILDYYLPIKDVSKFSMTRNNQSVYDHLIITKNDLYFGVVTIKDLLEKTSQIELNIARHSNPLTGLPGNILIEKNLQECMASCKNYCVLYMDLDNFKPYNDLYGFEKGDLMISLAGRILKKKVEKQFPEKSFIGHIGGDDFVATFCSSPEEAISLGEKIIDDFEKEKYAFFSEKDQKNGFFSEKNRKGEKQEFPLTTLSIAIVISSKHDFQNIYEISEYATKIKSVCKSYPQSICIAD